MAIGYRAGTGKKKKKKKRGSPGSIDNRPFVRHRGGMSTDSTGSGQESPVLSLGLTPAWQRTLLFDRFETGAVNRARHAFQSAAGKAVNVGLALALLGERSVVLGFNGGVTGRLLAADMRRRGVPPDFVRLAAETRTCTTILVPGGAETELVEEAPPLTERDLGRFTRKALRHLASCRALAISGTLPPAVRDESFYAPFAAAAARRGLPWVIDSHRGALLATLPHRPLVAKLNRAELEATCNVCCRAPAALKRAAARLTAGGARWVLVTDGPRPALLLADDGRAWRLQPARLARTVNPVGSGDCVTAGMLHALLRGRPPPAAARFGLACGSANAAALLPADFPPAAVRRLMPQCRPW